jgi:hypothetical protein
MTTPSEHTDPMLPLTLHRAWRYNVADTMRINRSLLIPILVYAVFSVICAGAIILLNQGHFTYTIDDPYIHLTLARNILHGYYGINPHEYAAPSSSILWPFLLAPFMVLPQAQLLPIIFNCLLSIGSLCIIHGVVKEASLEIHPERRQKAILVTVIVFMLVTNLVGLPFTGMEHSLQVFVALLVFAGLLCEQKTGKVSWWFGAAIILGPLVRYESLVVSGPVLIYLGWRKHYKVTFLCGALLVLALVSFSLFLADHGLGFLPSSVLAKSIGTQPNSFLVREYMNIVANVTDVHGMLLVLVGALLLRKRKTSASNLVFIITPAIAFHFVIGKFGWFSRYEIYIWTVAVLALLYVYRTTFTSLIERMQERAFAVRASLIVLICCTVYLPTQLLTPVAANNIYKQQYQMSRFVAEYYQKPVAVNDIGLVSYSGGQYVLDFYGLSSHGALEMYETQSSGDWLEKLATRHGTKLAMIYDSWFLLQPQSWIALGDLNIGKQHVGIAQGNVTFYAFDDITAREAIPLLQRYQATLPDGVHFEFRPSIGAQSNGQ